MVSVLSLQRDQRADGVTDQSDHDRSACNAEREKVRDLVKCKQTVNPIASMMQRNKNNMCKKANSFMRYLK